MGFLDKAKKLAEQAQIKLDEVQKQVNTGGSPGTTGSSGPIVEYDKHGRPIPQQQTATPPHGDPLTGPSSAPPAAPGPTPDPSAPPFGGPPVPGSGDPLASPPAPPAPSFGAPPASSHGDPLGGAPSPPAHGDPLAGASAPPLTPAGYSDPGNVPPGAT